MKVARIPALKRSCEYLGDLGDLSYSVDPDILEEKLGLQERIELS